MEFFGEASTKFERVCMERGNVIRPGSCGLGGRRCSGRQITNQPDCSRLSAGGRLPQELALSHRTAIAASHPGLPRGAPSTTPRGTPGRRPPPCCHLRMQNEDSACREETRALGANTASIAGCSFITRNERKAEGGRLLRSRILGKHSPRGSPRGPLLQDCPARRMDMCDTLPVSSVRDTRV